MKATLWLTAAVFVCLSSAKFAVADDPMPTPWNGMDIGGLSPAGTATANNGTFTLAGSGELSGTEDRFHFVYQSLTGDCALSARVTAEGNANDLESAGLMARQVLATHSDCVAVALTPGHGVTSTYRTLYAPQAETQSAGGSSPVWVKLVKRGTMVQSYMAADQGGTHGPWRQIGVSQPLPSGMIYVGLFQASHAQNGTATFDHVSLATGPQPPFDDGVYTIAPVGAPGMALAAAGDAVKLAAPTGAADQKWRVVSQGGGFYSFSPTSAPSLLLTVPGAKSVSGSPVGVAAQGEPSTQRWFVVTNSNGTYGLQPQFNTGISLDDFGGSATPSAVLDIWQYNSSDPHLQWLINPAP